MRFVPTLAVIAVFAVPVAAMADTIDFASGVTTVSFVNSTGSGAPTGTAVVYTGTDPYSVAAYTTPAPGSLYITYDDSTENLPAGNVDYIFSFVATGAGTGSVSFAADNSVVASVNGSEFGSSDTFASLTTDTFSFGAGTVTIDFLVNNAPGTGANPTALDFGGSASFAPAPPPPPPPTVPEPASIALLGTGVLTLAGFARRKRS
jgi:hypothetical protein